MLVFVFRTRPAQLALVAALALALALAGCSVSGTRYGVHVGNTLALREAGLGKAQVGEIRKDPEARQDVDRIKARKMAVEPVYGSYTAYLRHALESELDHADLLDPQAATRIDGLLLRNELGGSANLEYVLVEAELTVTRGGELAWRGRKTARHEWAAVFPGEVAIPRAVANYQVGMQRLIAAFIADPEFRAALGKR